MKSTTTKTITRKLIDATCATLMKGGAVSELTFLLAGYNRAQIGELHAAVNKRIGVCKVGVGIREAEGIPVYGDTDWELSGRGLRPGRELSSRENELYELARQGLSVSLWNRRTHGYLELPELMAEIAAAKELLAA